MVEGANVTEQLSQLDADEGDMLKVRAASGSSNVMTGPLAQGGSIQAAPAPWQASCRQDGASREDDASIRGHGPVAHGFRQLQWCMAGLRVPGCSIPYAREAVRLSRGPAQGAQLQLIDSPPGCGVQVATVHRLGRQAAQFIAAAADPLAALVDLPGNFPSKAAALSRLGLTRGTKAGLTALKRVIPAGAVRMSGWVLHIRFLVPYGVQSPTSTVCSHVSRAGGVEIHLP